MDELERNGKQPLPEPSDAARRQLLQGGFGALAAAFLGSGLPGCAGPAAAPGDAPDLPASRLGFEAVPASRADTLVVPRGYVARVLAAWGDPVGIAGAPSPAWRDDGFASPADQALQFGMHHDGLQFVPLAESSAHGLLVINHEYTDDGLLHPGGMEPWTAEKVARAQAAHGVSVAEVRLDGGEWQVVRPSRHARRITARTPCAITGPCAGHPLVRTAADPAGRRVLGTLANCANGRTPWGTVLVGEENFHSYFAGGDSLTQDQRRFGLRREAWYRWDAHDERFDTRRHPNEFHRFGWIVEVDPLDPGRPPAKRTALGRAAHEGAWAAATRDGRAVVYSGEDARFEYLYKFVSRDRIAPGGAVANRELLDHGTLYVARFDADGSGRWLPLVHGQGPLVAANGFADQAEVLIKTRQASDLLGATRMDRPEWLAIDAASTTVYCAMTANRDRGQPGFPGPDGANPRAANEMGHVLRWQEDGDLGATRLRWSHLLLAGDPQAAESHLRGNVVGDAFACPDTLALDPAGRLWIGTDVSPGLLNRGPMARLGNNQLLACDPATGEVRRFLTGPAGAEICGAAFTPDGTTLFVDIQHPGEPPGDRSDPAAPRRHSNWPDFRPGGRPRSATVVVRRADGGVVGT